LLVRLTGVAFVLSFFLCVNAFACGSWKFKDFNSESVLSFLVSSIELWDKKRPNPRFMSTHTNRAFFNNGDRIKYNSKNQIEILIYLGLDQDGKRKFKKEILGSYTKLSAELKKYGSVLLKVKNQKQISAYLNEKLVGQGEYKSSCFEKSDVNKEAFRVLSYFVWKSRNINPFAKAVDNWWW